MKHHKSIIINKGKAYPPINITPLIRPVINPLTPGAFCQNCIFGHFGGFEAESQPN